MTGGHSLDIPLFILMRQRASNLNTTYCFRLLHAIFTYFRYEHVLTTQNKLDVFLVRNIHLKVSFVGPYGKGRIINRL